jgi:hypothetical protein
MGAALASVVSLPPPPHPWQWLPLLSPLPRLQGNHHQRNFQMESVISIIIPLPRPLTPRLSEDARDAYDQLSGLHKTYLQTLKDDSSPPAVALPGESPSPASEEKRTVLQMVAPSSPPPSSHVVTDPHWDATAGAARSQDSTGGW